MSEFLIASDIHGSAYWCEQLLSAVDAESPEKIILLGDLLYHGPRNPLPDGYDPKRVIELLSPLKNRILCVRGNCDSEVDQMVLPFPMLADYALLYAEKQELFLTHGHLYSPDRLPPLSERAVLLNGHFHVPCHKRLESGNLYVNCGSVALPKENTPHAYVIFDGKSFVWKDLESGGIFDVAEI